MIIVTGAAGFIGSCMVSRLLQDDPGVEVVVVDDFSREDKAGNLQGKAIRERIDRDRFLSRFDEMAPQVSAIIHLGARTDTTSQDTALFDALNVNYSKAVWRVCTEQGIPLIYASSAATYGGGEEGYSDDPACIPRLRPLNPYGDSKQTFDLWVLEQQATPPFWAGIKFFNVYGPNEYHKGRMASVVWHAWRQIRDTGRMRLFRSHREGIADGEQQRDFIYVRDVVDVLHFLMEKQPASGIYNLGTGRSRSFLDLTRATFQAMELTSQIDFMDTPEDIRGTYQYYTQAEMGKLLSAGYPRPFTTLEEGVYDYVTGYLNTGRYC